MCDSKQHNQKKKIIQSEKNHAKETRKKKHRIVNKNEGVLVAAAVAANVQWLDFEIIYLFNVFFSTVLLFFFGLCARVHPFFTVCLPLLFCAGFAILHFKCLNQKILPQFYCLYTYLRRMDCHALNMNDKFVSCSRTKQWTLIIVRITRESTTCRD